LSRPMDVVVTREATYQEGRGMQLLALAEVDRDPRHADLPHAINYRTLTCSAAMGIMLADCQVDCQLLGRGSIRLHCCGRVQAAELVIRTGMDRPEQAGKS
jgi:hypothetical protein